ncbi:MAG TPA: SPOR domain-containing protein [Burkholderiales bacterium]|nr:SPOR domain-containing protein [Burkholderiales bacterium]
MAEAQDVNTLKRRGRRRLVGAIALVLLAVILLPMVFDSEPRQASAPVDVRIPGEETKFAPKLPAPPTQNPAAQSPAPQPAAAPHKAIASAAKEAPAPSAAERARAEAALAGIEYVVPVAALADPEGVKELASRLAAAKLPYYTERIATDKGRVTRVRAGPFASREAAEKARAKLKGLGLKPGNVTTKS